MSGIRKLPDYKCEGCRKTFRPQRTASRFCSRRCMWDHNGGGLRKLPLPQEVRRLLWFEELTTRQIADKYGCTLSAVHHYMVAHGIEAVKRRHAAQCIEPYCKKQVCEIKRWTNGIYKWGPTIRCYYHQQMKLRQIRRDYQRRYRNYKGVKGKLFVTSITPSSYIREAK